MKLVCMFLLLTMLVGVCFNKWVEVIFAIFGEMSTPQYSSNNCDNGPTKKKKKILGSAPAPPPHPEEKRDRQKIKVHEIKI